MASMAALAYCGLLIFYMVRRRRQCYDISEGTNIIAFLGYILFKKTLFSELFHEYLECGGTLLFAYLVHFVPYFFYDRTLFLHHYLTAYVFKLMLAAFMASHVYKIIR